MSQSAAIRSTRRSALFVSTALVALVASVPAHADDSLGRPFGIAEAQSGTASLTEKPFGIAEAYSAPVALAKTEIVTGPEPQIVISNPGTPTTARDPNNITGVAQMIVNNGGGSIGLCTGTLINPRTVIFAAHCVNSRPQTAYGANSGGTPIGFGFENNLRANNPGDPDELLIWLGITGNAASRTNLAQSFYNVNQVMYNPLSLEPEARSFLYGDVALATLDTPAAKIPTWALLFSQLPTPAINAAGTGYHVSIQGYGNNGTATTGSTGGIDYRRRIAENMIGGLTSLRTFETFLFGSSTSPTQNVYFIDFDDPRRGLAGASPFDFNAFRDPAQPNEGTTASGDSGGPLILDKFYSKPVVAGVLSGGYTRFFNGAPANGYGTVSFYQPLYLYWDYIVANNPYRYVTAAAGDGRWADPARWVTTLDPNYQIISGNTLVNGVPTAPGQQKNGTNNPFGEVCFETTTSSECLNVATNRTTLRNSPIGTVGDNAGSAVVTATDSAGSATVASLATGGRVDGSGAVLEAQDIPGLILPAASITNGLPGATNFVPNNSDGNRLTGAIGRYFDVTLGAAGTTTLDTVVTIDRFTMNNAGARLNITGVGSLTSLIDVTQVAGVTTVDGTLTSVGDYLIMGGGLTGSGRINSPFTTNIAATIAPGTAGTIGTLTFGGNLILASASQYLVDFGPNGTSDRINVVATTFNGATPTNGTVNLGGRVVFAPTAGTVVRFNDLYTIVTSQSALTGTFQAPTAISAILTPTLIYTANQVQARITAGQYINVANGTPVQRAYSTLLDQNRGQGGLGAIYDVLDLQSAPTIQSTLENLAPRTETLKMSMGIAVIDNLSRLYRERVTNLTPGALGGTVAYIGRPIQTAQLAAMPGQSNLQSDMSSGGSTTVAQGRLPDNMSGFLAGGYIDGSSRPMQTAIPGGRDTFDGFYIAAGIEAEIGERGVFGVSSAYSDVKGRTNAPQSATARGIQGTIYGKIETNGFYVDAVASAGLLAMRTRREATIVNTTYTLRSRDRALTIANEIGAGAFFGNLGSIQAGPRVALRYSYIGFSRTVEVGGPPALAIDRGRVHSLQGRAGLVVKSTGMIRPFASASYVHDFVDRPGVFGANFAGGIGPNVGFALSSQDQDWFEVGGGLAINTGRVELSISADTTLDRKDVRNQSYRGAIKFRF